MNKKAENLAFGVSFLAVLASFMLIVAPTLVAAPMYFPPLPPIEPPLDILIPDCEIVFNGICKDVCAGDEREVGNGAGNLKCIAPTGKCCKKRNICNTDVDPFSVPCFSAKDCINTDYICTIIGNDNNRRCCLEEQITICRNPGKPGQRTEIQPAHVVRGLDVGTYKFGTCCGQKQECTRVNGITQKPGCQEGFRCEQRFSSVDPTCCYPLETPTPTETPTPEETPMPTGTPESTETPVPTDTPEPTETPLPTDTPEPTETEVPTETPVPTSTEVPTSTPLPTSTP